MWRKKESHLCCPIRLRSELALSAVEGTLGSRDCVRPVAVKKQYRAVVGENGRQMICCVPPEAKWRTQKGQSTAVPVWYLNTC